VVFALSGVDAESMVLVQDTAESAGRVFALLEFGVLVGAGNADVMEGTEGLLQAESHMARLQFRCMIELAAAEDATEREWLDYVGAANKLDWACEDYQVLLIAGENEERHEGQHNDHLEKELATQEIVLALAGREVDMVIDVCSVGEHNHSQSAEGDMKRAFPRAEGALGLAVEIEPAQGAFVSSMVSCADLTVPFSCGYSSL
jgi:hypothetical protein